MHEETDVESWLLFSSHLQLMPCLSCRMWKKTEDVDFYICNVLARRDIRENACAAEGCVLFLVNARGWKVSSWGGNMEMRDLGWRSCNQVWRPSRRFVSIMKRLGSRMRKVWLCSRTSRRWDHNGGQLESECSWDQTRASYFIQLSFDPSAALAISSWTFPP